MSIFNNKIMLQGYVNRIGVHDGGNYRMLFLRVSIFSYMKDDKPQYDTITAQISCKVNQEGKLTTTSSHPKSKLNKQLFEYLNNNLSEGMPITLQGNIRGSEQVYLDGAWKNFKDLSSYEKETYKGIPKNKLITRNQTFVYIEEASIPNKSEFLRRKKKQELDNQIDKLKVEEPDQADLIETDDNDPVDNDGTVIEVDIIEPEVGETVKVEEAVRRKRGYVKFSDTIYSTPTDIDIPFD